MELTANVMGNQIARFMGPTWGSSGADRTWVGPMLAQWILLSGYAWWRLWQAYAQRYGNDISLVFAVRLIIYLISFFGSLPIVHGAIV